MAITTCIECEGEISKRAAVCPKCGDKQPFPWALLLVSVGVLVLAFLGFGAVVGNSPKDKERSADRRRIDMCWDDQKKKSLDPQAARFVAETCESLEYEFVRKHGHRP
jgi:hypothetical protein